MKRGLHTIVCLKVVPKPEEVSIDPTSLTLDRSKARSEINPPDMNALEAALKLKESHGGSVSILSMGPPFVERYLRVALAMGADAAYLLSDRAFGGADTLATSYTLAKAVEKIGSYDLILCGEESSDGATAQVPPGLAEWLGASQVTYATQVAIQRRGWQLRASREIKGGYEVLSLPLPAVVSLKLGVNEPRFMDFDRLAAVEAQPTVLVWSLADLGADESMVGLKGSATIVTGVSEAKTGERRREFLQGSPSERARRLVECLSEYIGLPPTVTTSGGR